jgi:hypothetical protein
MARSLDLDALTEHDLLQLLEEILNRLPVRDLVTVRIAAEAKRHEKLEEAKQAVVEEMRGKLEELDLTLEDVLQRPSRRGGADGDGWRPDEPPSGCRPSRSKAETGRSFSSARMSRKLMRFDPSSKGHFDSVLSLASVSEKLSCFTKGKH